MGRSNVFKNIENEFKFIGKEELKEIARESLGEILEALSNAESGEKLTFMLLLLGAKFGVSCDGVINVEEKELINEIFGPIWTGDISEIYKMIGTELTEQDYGMVENITSLGNDVAMPFLHFILSFAYIDGVFEDEVADRLDGLFGVNLLMDFMQSEEEDD